MIYRLILEKVEIALARQAAVALIGPRQVGKTTLALEIGRQKNAIYLDLQDAEDRNKISNPNLFLEKYEDRLVILDEIHRLPQLFDSLRGIIDRGRRNQRGKGRFLILGSASIDLLKQSSESLAGRIAYIDMEPLSVLEVDQDRMAREILWLRGGFPDSFLANSEEGSFEIRKDFIRTYLERDVPMFGPRVPATTLERLWTMLSHRHGSLLNSSMLARSLEISAQSVTRYIDLLSDLLLVRRLAPFHTNSGKRLVKTPKVYIRDSGLLHALLGISSFESLFGNPILGTSWEGFVIENIIGFLPWRAESYFYRTSAGAEVDLVITFSDNTKWAIEIKRGLSPRLGKGFQLACEEIKPDKKFLVHSGEDSYPIDHGVEAIGLIEICSRLFKAS